MERPPAQSRMKEAETMLSSSTTTSTSNSNSNSSNHGILELASQNASLQWVRRDSLEQMRHQTEFEIICELGSGAFGTTFKVRNRIDGKIYALKRVHLGPVKGEKANKLVREVEVLSSLNHENVVRYYSAWVEKGSDVMPDEEGRSDEDDTDSYYHNHYTTSASSEDWNNNTNNNDSCITNVQKWKDPVCHLCQSSYTDWEVSFEAWGLLDSVLQPTFLCTICYKKSLPSHVDVDTIHIRKKQIMSFYLFILMEYCESTLQEAVDAVHNLTNNNGPDKNDKESKDKLLWAYFAQCVQGLQHCHARGVIHRDLKPTNIFVHKGVVKLGDLGLATYYNNDHLNSIRMANNATNNSGSNITTTRQDTPDDRNCTQPKRDASAVTTNHDNDTERLPNLGAASLSSQVGTFLYAAPELAAGRYNEKCDVFSMGVVMVEMWSQFKTGMERAHVLLGLHSDSSNNNVLGTDWTEDHPAQSLLAQSMLSPDATNRPSCTHILGFLLERNLWQQKNPVVLQEIVSELQLSRRKLKESLEQKEDTIASLRRLLNANNIANDHIP
ncbi:eIF-2-alpha kinase GCN2 [Seminavis robusta]|uniref:EIF-2-alpha kinase GCN2 n=1 Tax=Seminavis robusta TaxID=568900 RepID=A0A9N8HHH8_9STRA|nr:eIF-2-alpha kinase GCN2 [Seminavis robusta]|eukprot:Sro637_g179420.1 eIF-2-alpha kinase GCN2 (554) ;mRNA; r:22965-24626